ncbi:MAG: hypothetical protein M1472_00010 [Planctomycetes bacterium]|nr:hypothetical protein [Planctomycetota bacterium]
MTDMVHVRMCLIAWCVNGAAWLAGGTGSSIIERPKRVTRSSNTMSDDRDCVDA